MRPRCPARTSPPRLLARALCRGPLRFTGPSATATASPTPGLRFRCCSAASALSAVRAARLVRGGECVWRMPRGRLFSLEVPEGGLGVFVMHSAMSSSNFSSSKWHIHTWSFEGRATSRFYLT